MQLIEAQGPVVVHAHGGLDPRVRTAFRGAPGASLRQLAPPGNLPTLCALNGDFVLPEDWDWVPSPGDHVAFVTLPRGGGGNASMQIIGVVLIVVGIFVPGAQALIYVGAALLASGLLPAPTYSPVGGPQGTVESASPTYNISLSGNTARIGQAIPVPYGRHLLVPDFASQPYTEFNEDSEQFYYALFCLGHLDKFTLESIMIDDTELSHFEEVETQLVGPDYTTPLSLVHPAVVNAPEVASQDMDQGIYIGPFACCGPGLRATHIGIDIVCPKGLYYAEDDGELSDKSAQWFVEARTISDSGAATGSWKLLGNVTLTAATNSAIRRSYKYTVTAGRYEVRVVRQDLRDENARAGHDVQWGGMRAYLNKGAPTQASATYLALKIRATSQLSGLSQRRISCIIRRWLPTWNPDDGWLPPSETSNPAWAIADALRNTDYGGAVPDDRIDLQTLYELSQVWAARNDRFDCIFDKRITIWNAISTIARAGRARPIMRGGIFTFIRDAQQELPVAAFTMRNIKRGSFSIDYNLPSDDTVDGLELTYFDATTWSEQQIQVRINPDNTIVLVGEGDDPPVDPAKLMLAGIVYKAHAQREALYMAADMCYRTCSIAFTTELEGYLPCYGDLIAVSHDIAGWGTNGEIEDWEQATLTAVCTEEITWTVGNNYAILVSPMGDVYGPYLVEPGDRERSMHFIEEPDPAVEIYTGAERERTRFAMGPANAYSKLCRIISITPKSGVDVEIRAVVEDNRVHTVDGGGGGGGGGGDGEVRVARYAPDDIPVYDAASEEQHAAYGFYTEEDLTVGTADDPGYVYAPD